MSRERQSWLACFHPCWGTPIKGFSFSRCADNCRDSDIICLRDRSFQVVRYVVQGSTLMQEKRDFASFLDGQYGEIIREVDGNMEFLDRSNVEGMVDKVVDRAKGILNTMDVCIEQTLPLTQEYLAKCSAEQNEALEKIEELRKRAEFFGANSVGEAETFMVEMRTVLSKAIDLGLDELGYVARMSIGYGLGERVLGKRGISISYILSHVGKLERTPD